MVEFKDIYEEKFFKMFLEHKKKECTNPNLVFSETNVCHNDVDITKQYLYWMELSMRGGDTSWLK